eukprot:scaffold287_cov151-Skeletonema_marinoi.AAC.11
MQIKQATEEAQHAARERNKGAKRLIRLDEMMANRRFRVSKRRAEARVRRCQGARASDVVSSSATIRDCHALFAFTIMDEGLSFLLSNYYLHQVNFSAMPCYLAATYHS